MDTNRYYLAAILEVFSDSTDPAHFLPLCHQIPFDFHQSAGIEHRQILSDF